MSDKNFVGTTASVNYRQASVGDPKFEPIFDWVSDRLGTNKKEIKAFVKEKTEKGIKGLQAGQGTKAMQSLEYENQLFALVQQAVKTMPEEERIFDPKVFSDMLDKVLMGSKRFHRISNAYNPKKTTPKMTYYPSVGWDLMVKEGLISNSPQAIPDTAWCDPKCIVAFNRDFAEALLQYGEIVGINSKDKDYRSNGGNIPDGYAYIEFTIAHELLHYTNGDHIYPNRYKIFKKVAMAKLSAKFPEMPETALRKRAESLTHQTINWLGDFINNHQLIKAGFEQLPIGLYSEEINADQGLDYFKLYEKAMELMETLSDETKKEKQEQSDQHMEDGEDKPKEHGDPQGEQSGGSNGDPFADPNDQDNQSGEGGDSGEMSDEDKSELDDINDNMKNGSGSGEGEDDQKDGDEDSKDGKGNGDKSDDSADKDSKSSSGDGEDDDTSSEPLTTAETPKTPQDNSGSKSDDLGKGKKGSDFTQAEKDELERLSKEMENQFKNNTFEKENNGVDIQAQREQNRKEADNRRQEVERLQREKAEEARLQKIDENAKMKTPSVGWKEIIKRMISGVLKKEEVWSKMHRTTTANLGSGVAGGTFMRPGEKREKSSDKKKLVFLIDTSYSVGEMMKSVNMQILKTLKAGKMQDCYIMRFASTEELYHLDIKTGKGYRAKPQWKTVFRNAVTNGVAELEKSFLPTPIKFSEILSTQQSGGTEFTTSTVNLLRVFDKLGYDVLMFTDSDITWSGNLDNFKTVCTEIFKKFTKKNFSLILSEDSDYDNVVRALGYGEGNRWISTFKKDASEIKKNNRIGKGHFN